MSSPPILPLGVSKRAGCDIFWSLSRKRDGYATQPNPMCHRTYSKTWNTIICPCYGTTAVAVFICCPAIGVPAEISQSGATRSLAAHCFRITYQVCKYVHQRGHWVCWMSTSRKNGLMWRTQTPVIISSFCCCLLHQSMYSPARSIIVCCTYVCTAVATNCST